MTAGTMALWIAAAFALLSVVMALRAGPDSHESATPFRALVMASVFAATAFTLLERALWRGDLSVDFVVRHTMLDVGRGARALAVFANPAGAGLTIAFVLGVCSVLAAWREHSRVVVAVAATAMLVLLAAPLAGGPMAPLAWAPVDGQSPALFFRQAMALPYAAAQTGAVVAAAITLGLRVQEWWGGSLPASGAAHLMRLTVVCLVWQAMAHEAATVAAGLTSDVRPFLAGGSRFGLAVAVAAVAHGVSQSPAAAAQSRVEASLGALLAALSLALAPAGVDLPPLSVRALAMLGASVAVLGAWRARAALAVAASDAWRHVRHRRGLRLVPLSALGFGLAAALSGLGPGGNAVTLESGGRVSLGRGTELAHLGVSRYEGEGVDVLALAVERHAGTQVQLASAERREYHDARGSIIGPQAALPAVLRTARGPLYVWLDDVESGDRVRLRIALLPGLWLAWIAVALCSIWVALPVFRPTTDQPG